MLPLMRAAAASAMLLRRLRLRHGARFRFTLFYFTLSFSCFRFHTNITSIDI